MSQTAVPVRRDSRLPNPLRWLAGLMAVVVLGANTLIMLSDRAPGLLRRLSARLDVSAMQTVSAPVTPVGRLPETDFMIHVVLWALAAVLAAVAMGSLWSRVFSAGVVLAYSVVLEVAQGVYTSSRSPQRADLVGNAIGVAAGLAVAVAVGLLLWLRPARARPGPGRLGV